MTYENSYYIVNECNMSYGGKSIITIPKAEYIPRIYVRINSKTFNIGKVEVETTSYGTVSKEEIDKIVKGDK